MGATEGEVVCRPHLVLPHACDPDSVLGGGPIEVGDDLLRLKQPIVGVSPARGIGGLDALDLTAPRGDVHPSLGGDVVMELCGQGGGQRPARSPTIGTSAVRILEISAGSTSTWMTDAFVAKVSGLPVTRSSKRAPRQTMTSARWRAPTAATVPCMPGIRRLSGCSLGMTSSAVSVVTKGSDEVDELGEILRGHLSTVQATAEIENGAVGCGNHLSGLGQRRWLGLLGRR